MVYKYKYWSPKITLDKQTLIQSMKSVNILDDSEHVFIVIIMKLHLLIENGRKNQLYNLLW